MMGDEWPPTVQRLISAFEHLWGEGSLTVPLTMFGASIANISDEDAKEWLRELIAVMQDVIEGEGCPTPSRP